MRKGFPLAVLVLLVGVLVAACDAEPSGEVADLRPSPSLATAEATSGSGASSENPPPSPTWPPFLQSPTPAGDSTGIAEEPIAPTETAVTETTPALPVSTATAPTPGPGCIPAPPPGWVAAAVRPGDTIGRLAQCVGVSPAEIVAVNCLPNNGNLIYSGQMLYLPRPCAPTATPTPTGASRTDGTDTPSPPPPITTPGPPQPGEDGIVIIDPQRAEPGVLVIVKFSNFSRNELVTASFVPLVTNVPLTTTVQAYMNDDGVGQAGFFIPLSFPTGRIAVKAEDPYQSGEGLLIVLPPAPTPTATATPTATIITTETPAETPEPTLTPTPDGAAEASATPTETIEPASNPP